MAITLNGTTGITTPDLTSAAPMDVGGSAVLTAASSLAAANLTGTVASGRMPAGSVLQAKQNIYDASNSFASTLVNVTGYSMGGWIDTGVSLSFTPISSSSRIILNSSINFATTNFSERISFKIVRDTGTINPVTGMGAIDSLRRMCHASTLYLNVGSNENLSEVSMNTYDEPNTLSAVTYKVYVNQNTGSATIYINRPTTFPNAYYIPKAISTLTGFEVKQ